MHLVALASHDQALNQALSSFKHPEHDIYLHPIPAHSPLERVAAGLEPLDFAGLLVLEPSLQPQAFQLASRRSLDAQEVAAADALTVTPGGLIAEYNLGRAVGAALHTVLWNPREANVVILGTGAPARAISRELSSLGATHLTVLAANRPLAETTVQQLAANTEITAKAEGDPLAAGLIERADLLVRVDSTMAVSDTLLGPHLTLVDLAKEAMSPLRQRALNLGALTVGVREVQAQQLALSLGHVLGGRLEPGPFAELLHSL